MKLAGTRARELQQEASLAIVLRIYRCDGRRTDARRGAEETRTTGLVSSLRRAARTAVLLHA